MSSWSTNCVMATYAFMLMLQKPTCIGGGCESRRAAGAGARVSGGAVGAARHGHGVDDGGAKARWRHATWKQNARLAIHVL